MKSLIFSHFLNLICQSQQILGVHCACKAVLRYHDKCHQGCIIQVLEDLKRAANEDQEPVSQEVLGEIDLIKSWGQVGFWHAEMGGKKLQVEGSAWANILKQEGIESILFALKKSKGSSLACRMPSAGGQSGSESHIARKECAWETVDNLYRVLLSESPWHTGRKVPIQEGGELR